MRERDKAVVWLPHLEQLLVKALGGQAVGAQVALQCFAKCADAAKPHAGLFPVCYLGAHMLTS